MSQTVTIPEPETSFLRSFEGPFLASHFVAIPSDEVNPDTLTSTIGMAIGALEGAVEAEEMAADWESFAVTRYPRAGYLLIQVSVKHLAS